MSDKDYDFYFKKFYNDFFKFQSGAKKFQKCNGCSMNKRFIFGDNKLIYSCGPSNNTDKKCGKQYTIEFPKYINYRDLYELYNNNINGSSHYSNDIMEYNLEKLCEKMDLNEKKEEQLKLIKESNDSLKKLIHDYIQTNELDHSFENLKTLSKRRHENSIKKQKLMIKINDKDINELDKKELRKEYAQLVHESKEFIDMIIQLRKSDTDFIIVENSKIIDHIKDSPKESKESPKDSPKESPKESKESPKDSPKESSKEKIKYSYDDQIKILIKFYKHIGENKSDEDVIGIVNRRRNKGTPIGTRIPTKPWLELCKKLKEKYNVDPLNIQKKKKRLYDPEVVFLFYSKSRDRKPGEGSGETITEEKKKDYEELDKIKQWRKKLSNFYESEFKLDGKRWLSVEHYYQGSKFKKENPEFYEKFSLDSDSDISKSPVLAKSAGGKSGKSKGNIIRPSNIKMDKDFFENHRSSDEMKKAQYEKFTQNEELKDLLIKTKEAKLTHHSRGSPPIVFKELMEIRNEL